MGYQFQWLYSENVQFVTKEIHYPINELEIKENLTHKRKILHFHQLLRYNTYIVLCILFIFVPLILGGTLILLFSGLYSGVIFVTKFSLLHLFLFMLGTSLSVFTSYYVLQPILLNAYDAFKYLFAHTSTDRLYSYLIETGKISEGVVKSIEISQGKQIITYSFVPKDAPTRRDEYFTSSSSNIKIGNSLYILYSAKISIVL